MMCVTKKGSDTPNLYILNIAHKWNWRYKNENTD